MPARIPGDVAAAAVRGEEPALLRLLVLCRPDLTRYARRSCESDDVEEAVQDALWLIYRRIGGLRTGAALSAWMFQVVRRLCHRFTLRRRVRDRVTAPLDDELAGNRGEDDLRLDLVRALAELPRGYREVLVRRDIQGFEASEVAAQLGIGVQAVKSRLHRARALMREMLRPASRSASPQSAVLAEVRP